jgi:hypothetical protein
MALTADENSSPDETGRGSAWTENRALVLLLGLMVVTLAGLFLLPPIPQDQDYHRFADTRSFLGIPNAWNVLSNLPFIAIGVAGLARFRTPATTVVLFLGVLLTGFGSAYYHLMPNDQTLFWDRLPMTLGFMAILAGTIERRVHASAGAVLLWPLLVVGVFSLLLWRWTDDLRLYAWVQFFPILVLPPIFLLIRPKYTGTWCWVVAAVLYALAKVFEHFDAAIQAANPVVSGHTLKHIAAAAACLAIFHYFRIRRPLAQAMATARM